jgi:hypothetical protein
LILLLFHFSLIFDYHFLNAGPAAIHVIVVVSKARNRRHWGVNMTFHSLLIHKMAPKHLPPLFFSIGAHQLQLIHEIIEGKVNLKILHHIKVWHVLAEFACAEDLRQIVLLVCCVFGL